MIAASLSAMWSALAPALGNHLWQSTLFAGVAALLTLLLRSNQARVRYWLWLAASLKFLIPFSLLVGLGNLLPWPHGNAPKAGVYFVIEEVVTPAGSSPLTLSLSALLLAVWLCGFAAVVFVWCARWRHVSHELKKAAPLRPGRELEMLRQVERRLGITARIDMVTSQGSLEPGVFRMFRPVLLWPAGISEHLDDAQLQAILAHEVSHVRRRDNLAAVAHMVVEAVFWFHPLVWWLGSWLVEERERACDEAVLEMGSDRNVYAESILKVCELCVASPLACVSGVTGADLKKRMVHIMTDEITRKLNFSRKLLLSVAGFLALALPIVFGLINATPGSAQVQPPDSAKTQPQPVHVSPAVMQALIREKVPPQYPADAKTAGIQGKVVLIATISKEGDVKNLQVKSGPPALAPAAIEAVKQWKYKPFLLNGQPVEVETGVNITFSLSK
jgi:TonB family protein